MQRVLVIGNPGAGKSTFSAQLAARTGLPLIALDAEFWQRGWVETEHDEWRDKLDLLLAGDHWIMDGTYASTLDLRLPRADTVIWFDTPRVLCLQRALWRTVWSLGRVRPGMAAGCRERLDHRFLRYVWTFEQKFNPRIAAALKTHGDHLAPVIFRHDADARRFLDNIQARPLTETT